MDEPRITATLFGMMFLLSQPAPASEVKNWSDDLDIHGFFSAGFLTSSENNYLADSSDGSFEFNEVGLNAGVQLTDNLRLGAQVFTRDLGALGNYDVELDWAFLDWRARDWLGMRVGRIKLPYGLHNETADVDAVRTSILLPQAVYRSGFRDFLVSMDGAALYGYVPLAAAGGMDYQVYVGQNQFSGEGSIARLFSDSGVFAVDDVHSSRTSGVHAIWQTPVSGLRLGFSKIRYDDNYLDVTTDPMFVTGFGFPAQTRIEVPEFDVDVLSVEYSASRWSVTAEQTRWKGDFFNPVYGDTPHFGGHYLQGSVRVSERLEVGGYYSVYYPNLDDKDGDLISQSHEAYQKDLALSFRIDLTSRWLVKLEYHDMSGTGQVLNQDNPTGKIEDWNLMAAKASFAF